MSRIKLCLEPSFPKSGHNLDFDSPCFFVGSCFSDNISSMLSNRKFHVLSNPSGILFDVLSIERCIKDIVSKRPYLTSDLFLYNELYSSWNHHTSFSDLNAETIINQINDSNLKAYDFIRNAEVVFITLGSAFSYYHTKEKRYVSNCHKVPQIEFEKRLLSAEDIYSSLNRIHKLFSEINAKIKTILTISPVRHLRDGIIENNRSKAKLIEACHRFIESTADTYYFPSYEIVLDVLRDYRFFDIDLAHPNYLATEIVFDYLKTLCIHPKCYEDMEAFYQLTLAMKHRPRQPQSNEHLKFLKTQCDKIKHWQKTHPTIDFTREFLHFQNEINSLEVRL